MHLLQHFDADDWVGYMPEGAAPDLVAVAEALDDALLDDGWARDQFKRFGAFGVEALDRHNPHAVEYSGMALPECQGRWPYVDHFFFDGSTEKAAVCAPRKKFKASPLHHAGWGGHRIGAVQALAGPYGRLKNELMDLVNKARDQKKRDAAIERPIVLAEDSYAIYLKILANKHRTAMRAATDRTLEALRSEHAALLVTLRKEHEEKMARLRLRRR
jgi:hypothetical protein